ncbi:MAG: hypothetical protein ABW220_01230 [Burkholderiaceae bacterium]
MDQAYISTISALSGTVIGGLTSFATSWLVQHAQARAARLAVERTKREDLYGRFLDTLSLLYSDALSSEKMDYAKLVDAFALKGRVMLLSTAPVVDSADVCVKTLVDLYMGPRLTPEAVRAMMEHREGDIFRNFTQVCREELQKLRVP